MVFGSVPDTDFLTYQFEFQQLREEIAKLIKELELAKKVCFETVHRWK